MLLKRLIAVTILALASSVCVAIEPGRLWIYAAVNFQVDENIDELIDIMRRGHDAGYNGLVVTDYKFGNLQDRPANYYKNLKRVREQADQLNIELIPCVMPVGYSNAILQNNPNLAAGLPVKDCSFVVAGNQATVADARRMESGFESADKGKPTGWDWIDGWGTSTGLDSTTFRSGQSSLRMRNFKAGQEGGNCRVVQNITLVPHRQYRLTLWSKSQDLNADLVQFYVSANGKPLSHKDAAVKPTQDWTRHDIVFNSLDSRQASIYLGIWTGHAGTLWIDDVQVEEVGGLNLLRRPGCPIEVRDAATAKLYQEGVDYVRWTDPKLGQVPYAGEFAEDHDATPITLTPQSAIVDGQKLNVSFYHTVIVHQAQVSCALAEDELFDLFAKQVRSINQIWQPKTYFLQHDEIRVAGYDALSGDKTAGQMLADNVRRCAELMSKEAPDAELVFWSDMFDPHHNAVDNYYLTKKTMKDSWEGLPSSSIIANWNSGKASESLHWFDDRKHPQIIAGYYDGPVDQSVPGWKTASQGVNGIRGWMYTTWTNNYDDMESYAKTIVAD